MIKEREREKEREKEREGGRVGGSEREGGKDSKRERHLLRGKAEKEFRKQEINR